jgi:hypothetical protein
MATYPLPQLVLKLPFGRLSAQWPRALVVKGALFLAAISLCLVPIAGRGAKAGTTPHRGEVQLSRA